VLFATTKCAANFLKNLFLIMLIVRVVKSICKSKIRPNLFRSQDRIILVVSFSKSAIVKVLGFIADYYCPACRCSRSASSSAFLLALTSSFDFLLVFLQD
jgi:hypothetical protein